MILNIKETDIEIKDKLKSISEFNETLEAQKALNELYVHLLGKDFYNEYCWMRHDTLNFIMLENIECKYRKKRKIKVKVETKDEIKIRIIELSDNMINGVPSIDAQKALNELCDYLLGDGWYVVDPLSNIQLNHIIVESIERLYRKRKKVNFKLKITKEYIN